MGPIFVRVRRIGLCAVRVPVSMCAIAVTVTVGVTVTVAAGFEPNNIGREGATVDRPFKTRVGAKTAIAGRLVVTTGAQHRSCRKSDRQTIQRRTEFNENKEASCRHARQSTPARISVVVSAPVTPRGADSPMILPWATTVHSVVALGLMPGVTTLRAAGRTTGVREPKRPFTRSSTSTVMQASRWRSGGSEASSSSRQNIGREGPAVHGPFQARVSARCSDWIVITSCAEGQSQDQKQILEAAVGRKEAIGGCIPRTWARSTQPDSEE
jgi:hypothetical protein